MSTDDVTTWWDMQCATKERYLDCDGDDWCSAVIGPYISAIPPTKNFDRAK
jgi:hypothetical protein